MGKGMEMARLDAPEHVAMLDDLKDQLLIVFLRRLGRKVSIPVAEVDDTGQEMLAFQIDDDKVFHFELKKKS
jgi:hypothetical protein